MAGALALAACASTPKSERPTAARPPNGDEVFGLVGPETPEGLRGVSASPYAAPEPRTCEEVARQIAELDALLGPDVDVAHDDEDQVAEWARGAVRGLVPYRGVVRFLTGASKKERAMAAAVLAGAARRGYLKGVRESLSCRIDAAATGVGAAP